MRFGSLQPTDGALRLGRAWWLFGARDGRRRYGNHIAGAGVQDRVCEVNGGRGLYELLFLSKGHIYIEYCGIVYRGIFSDMGVARWVK